LIDGLIFIVTTLAGFAGAGLALDTFVFRGDRKLISKYVFGHSRLNTESLEVVLMRSLLAPFLRQGRVSLIRVLIYSILFSFCVLSVLSYWTWGLFSNIDQAYPTPFDWAHDEISRGNAGDVISVWIDLFFKAVQFGCATVWLDYISVWFSKKLFLDRSPKYPRSAFYFLIDVLVSCGLGVVLFLILWLVSKAVDLNAFGLDWISALIGIAAFFATASALLWSALQLMMFVVGTTLRSILLVTKMNDVVSDNSLVFNYPFGYMFCLVGVMAVVLKLGFGM
jgi:hypothetical protein